MLYVRYVHLTKAGHVDNRQNPPLVREDVTQGLCRKRSVAKKIKSDREPQGAWRPEEMIGIYRRS
jgi:hypothetical protein